MGCDMLTSASACQTYYLCEPCCSSCSKMSQILFSDVTILFMLEQSQLSLCGLFFTFDLFQMMQCNVDISIFKIYFDLQYNIKQMLQQSPLVVAADLTNCCNWIQPTVAIEYIHFISEILCSRTKFFLFHYTIWNVARPKVIPNAIYKPNFLG